MDSPSPVILLPLQTSGPLHHPLGSRPGLTLHSPAHSSTPLGRVSSHLSPSISTLCAPGDWGHFLKFPSQAHSLQVLSTVYQACHGNCGCAAVQPPSCLSPTPAPALLDCQLPLLCTNTGLQASAQTDPPPGTPCSPHTPESSAEGACTTQCNTGAFMSVPPGVLGRQPQTAALMEFSRAGIYPRLSSRPATLLGTLHWHHLAYPRCSSTTDPPARAVTTTIFVAGWPYTPLWNRQVQAQASDWLSPGLMATCRLPGRHLHSTPRGTRSSSPPSWGSPQ